MKPESCPPIEYSGSQGDLWRRILSVLVPPAVLILAVLGSILLGVATPTEAAAVGSVGAILLAGQRVESRLRWLVNAVGLAVIALIVLATLFDLRMQREEIPESDLYAAYGAGVCCLVIFWGLLRCLLAVKAGGILTPVMRSTLQISAMVFVILLGASVFSLVFRGLGGERIVEDVLKSMPGGAFGAMLLVMALMFVMGFFLDFIEIVFVVVPIVGPVLLQMDISPVWFGVMIAINLQTSFLTPPFGFALFYLRGVAPPSVTTMDIYRGIIPFVGIQILGLIILAAFPSLATWLPEVLFRP